MDIEQIDGKGGVVTITEAHWSRYPQLAQVFRPVAEKKATTSTVKAQAKGYIAGLDKAEEAVAPPEGDGNGE